MIQKRGRELYPYPSFFIYRKRKMQIKLKLIRSQFLFSENINLIKNKEVVVDSDTLTNTDIKILSGKIRSEELESNVSADKILEFLSEDAIQELKEAEPKVEEVKAVELQAEPTVEAQEEVVDEKIAEEDVVKSILDEVEEYSTEDNISKIEEKIINASNSMAAKNVAELSESGESKEFFQHALDVEKSTKNRKSVIAAITKHI